VPGMCSECMAEVHGAESYPMVSWGGSAWAKSMELNHILWSRGVTASTLDPESSDGGSNPRETFLQQQVRVYVMIAERTKQCCTWHRKHAVARELRWLQRNSVAPH